MSIHATGGGEGMSEKQRCRWCEQVTKLCACGICASCHGPFWGKLPCVKTKKEQAGNVKKY